MINKIIKRTGDTIHPRTQKIWTNTAVSLVLKGVGMIITFVLVPITIDYLSKDVYGVWLTISSTLSMLTFFDIGIGNGLRNKLSEALSKGDVLLSRTYVSTAYAIFGVIQLAFIILFLIVFRFLPLQSIFQVSINNTQLQLIILITSISISIKLFLDILIYALLSHQYSFKVNLISFITNIITLCTIFILYKTTASNILYLSLVTSLSPIVVLVCTSIVEYNRSLSNIRPAFKYVDFSYAKDLFFIGYKFFIIQISIVIIFYTDNLIIIKYLGSGEVTVYNIAFRYFNIVTTIFTIALTPYWSAFTEAYIKNDKIWIVKTYQNLIKLWLSSVIVVIFMIILSQPIYKIWIGERVTVPTSLSLFMGLFVIINAWNSFHNIIINGIGKIKLQLYVTLGGAIINVPMAVFLCQNDNLNINGIVIASMLSIIANSYFSRVQVKKILRNELSGIWNR